MSRYIYQKELNKAFFQHDMANVDSKVLKTRTIVDKVLCDKVFDIAKNQKHDEYQHGLGSIIYKFFDEKNYFTAR